LAEFIFGAANRLDKFSMYLTPQMLATLKEQMRGRYVGVGLEVRLDGDELVVAGVIKNSPAEEAGIKVGYRITFIDGEPTFGKTLTDLLCRIRGPEGRQVRLTVRRPDEAVEREVVLVRARIGVSSVPEMRIVDRAKGIGYVKLTVFSTRAPKDLAGAIRELKLQGLNALVLDLRGNPGGLLRVATSVCGQFISRGNVVSAHGRGLWPSGKYDVSPWNKAIWDGPLAVLVDRSTASAAEIVAAALKAHGRAVIVGRPTYGKDALQCIFPLEWGQSALDLTTRWMKTPGGKAWHEGGILPDVVVSQNELPEKHRDAKTDATIDAALSALRRTLEATEKKMQDMSR